MELAIRVQFPVATHGKKKIRQVRVFFLLRFLYRELNRRGGRGEAERLSVEEGSPELAEGRWKTKGFQGVKYPCSHPNLRRLTTIPQGGILEE